MDAQEATYSIERLRTMRDTHEEWVASRLSGETEAITPQPDNDTTEEWGDPDVLPAHLTSDQIFARRLSDAFPGGYGITEITEQPEAIERLRVVLRKPLDQWHFDGGERRRIHPFWWFRGSLCLHIEEFEQISASHCLLDVKELNVRRVAALRRSYYSIWDCLYVEVNADTAVGVYQRDEQTPEERAQQSSMGYYDYEEFALWSDRPISRADFDDGATLVNGKPRRVTGAEIRQRFLTPYNFIVCGNRHVINENRHDRAIQALLDGLLRGSKTLDDLWRFVGQLEKPARYYSGWD